MEKQSLITEFFASNDKKSGSSLKRKRNKEKTYGYNKETNCWHCISCGQNMGPNNPRQLCQKTFCYEELENPFKKLTLKEK